MGEAFSELMKSIKAGKFVYTGELEPHKSTEIAEVVEWARTLKATGKIIAANVTDNPQSVGAISSLAASHIIQKDAGLEVIYQLRTSDRNRLALVSDLLGASLLGIRNVLALTGDHVKKGDTPQSMSVHDLDGTQLVDLMHKMVYEGKDLSGNEIHGPRPQFNIGAAGNPNFEPVEAEALKLERKAKVGVDFFQTQVVFDVNTALRFLDAIEHLGVPVLIGIFPPKSLGQAKYFDKFVPGVRVPQEFLEKFKKFKSLPDKKERKAKITEYNIEYFADFVKEAQKKPVCKGIHIMAVGYPEVIGPIIESAEKA